MTEGFARSGFTVTKVVEQDQNAIAAHKENHKGISIYPGHVLYFLLRLKHESGFRESLGIIDHIHHSSRRRGYGQNTPENDDHATEWLQAVKLTRCLTASYIDFLGLWKQENHKYLKKLLRSLLKRGYQVRCSYMNARDFGDSLSLPCLVILIARKFCPLPFFPVKTNGTSSDLLPFVTPRQRLQRFEGQSHESGCFRLNPDEPAPVEAWGQVPLHYSENRFLTVQEAAALCSFPRGVQFCGTEREKHMQIQNCVPVELATAIAYPCQLALLYELVEEKKQE